MENQSFSSLIQSIKSPLILLPLNPYFDQVAAGLSLYLALKDRKNLTIACSSPMIVEFNRLVGVDKITQEVGNKNLVIKFVNYPANDIERVSYDIENQQFRLTVVPKPEVIPPKKDQVEITYSGLSADAVILIGGANKSHFPLLSSKDVVASQFVHIGTRDLEGFGGDRVISFAKPLSSTSEVVADLLKASGYELTEDISSNLLMGIEEGSKNFSGQGVTADTFALISELMRKGGRRAPEEQPEAQRLAPMMRQQQPQVAGETPPKSWLQEPKIYKGTSIS